MTNKKKTKIKIIVEIILTALFVLSAAFLVWFISGEGATPAEDIAWGVSFSPAQAQYLGLDWHKVYTEILDDMKIRNLRLAVPWDNVEKMPGVYDFSDIDWLLDEAAKRDASVILAVGRKLFRWPECHDPAWARGMNKEDFEKEVLYLVETTVERYKNHPAVAAWQVENEVLLAFGDCDDPSPTWRLFSQEVSLVRTLDPSRPVVSTESGELSSWIVIGSQVDRLGTSLYRVTHNPIIGKIYLPFRPGFYAKKTRLAKAVNPNLQEVFLSELQLEPWGEKPLVKMTLAEQFDRMSFARALSTVEYAQRAGFDEIYIWGVEWWYWLKENHQDNRFWDMGKDLMGDFQQPISRLNNG